MPTSLKFIIDYKPKVESGELIVFAMNPEPQKVEIIKGNYLPVYPKIRVNN